MLPADEEKRWLVVGMTMNKVLLPVLRDYIKQGMDTLYASLDKSFTLKTLTYHQVNTDRCLQQMKFRNVNNNFHLNGRKLYNYNINSSVDLAKLYLQDIYAEFSAFDESLDFSAILLLLGHNSPTPIFRSPNQLMSIQTSADDVRRVHNKWGHTNFTDWTEVFFNNCFDKMKTLVKSLGLIGGVQKNTLDRISVWQKNGKELEDSVEEWTQVLYRAGTDESPSFEVVNDNEVWLIRNPALYYPLDQGKPRYSTRANPVARLWKTFISVAPDTLVTERHPSLKEIVIVKLKEPERENDGAEKLKEILRSMNWTRSTVPRCERGMSLMNVSILVRAVLKYLHDNCPVTPEEFNFQAELKAASHWYWFNDNEQIQFVSGPFDDIKLIKKVAEITLRSWINELGEIEKQANKSKLSSSPKMREDAIEEQISDLEEDIFSLRMYYNMTLEENDDTSSSTDCEKHSISSTVKEDSPKRASPRRILGASTKLPVAVYYGKKSKRPRPCTPEG